MIFFKMATFSYTLRLWIYPCVRENVTTMSWLIYSCCISNQTFHFISTRTSELYLSYIVARHYSLHLLLFQAKFLFMSCWEWDLNIIQSKNFCVKSYEFSDMFLKGIKVNNIHLHLWGQIGQTRKFPLTGGLYLRI